jgi:hypothetical protein
MLLRGITLLLAVVLACTAHGQTRETAPVAQIQASHLINFLRYTEWPEESAQPTDAPLVIAVAGPAWLASTVRAEARANGPVRQRPLLVRHLRMPRHAHTLPIEVERELRRAHLLFIHTSHAPLQPQLLERVADRPVLTVGTTADFTAAGGMFVLRQQDMNVVFDANPEAIRASGLMVSARVLKMARNADLGR